jgi:uncharacterized membrane protein
VIVMRKIWNTMLRGLVAMLPIGLTLYLVYWLAVTAEHVFSGLIRLLLPETAYWPGLGVLTGLVLLYLAGLALNAYLVRRALRIGDQLFARIPVVKTVYVAIRDFMRFFPSSGAGGDLKRVVMVPYGPGRAIGFVTSESAASLGLGDQQADKVAVYLPLSYMIGGQTVFVARGLLEPTTLSVEAGMRIALMGGVQARPSQDDAGRPGA